jgi:hypothetical protein
LVPRFKQYFVVLFAWLLAIPALSANAETATITVVSPTIEGGAAGQGFPVPTLVDEIEAALVSTRVFTVMTSDSAELDILLNELRAGGNSVKPTSKTAQFVVVPVIQAIEINRTARPVPKLNAKSRITSKGLVRMRVKIIETRTGVIKAPFPVDVDWTGEAEVVDRVESGSMPLRQADFVAMAREAGRVCASAVLDQIYPVEVIGRADNQVWISRGGDAGYEVGDVLRVMTGKGQSEQLIHPVTGEVLGVQEKKLGTIKVVDVQPKFTVGEIIDEPGGTIVKGSIIRK